MATRHDRITMAQWAAFEAAAHTHPQALRHWFAPHLDIPVAHIRLMTAWLNFEPHVARPTDHVLLETDLYDETEETAWRHG